MISKLNLQKSDLMEQVEKHKKKKCELKQMISELTKEVSCHEEKLSETNNIIERLKNEIKELQNIGENYKLRSEVKFLRVIFAFFFIF